MDKIFQGLIELGATGAALGVLYLLMMHILKLHKEEREIAQDKSDQKYESALSTFKDEMQQSREACSKDSQKHLEAFEKNIDRIRSDYRNIANTN